MMEIGGIRIGQGSPCRFVAELSNNHNGDRDRLGRLIDAAQAAGADCVKVQCYTPDELVTLRGDGPAPEPWGAQGWTMRTLYEKAQTPLDWFPKIAAHCERIGMPWFASVFGRDSLACLDAVGCPAYKIAALDSRHRWLREIIRGTGKPVLRSVAQPETDAASRNELRLYCPPGYPTPLEEIQLPWFGPQCLGLSSHCLAPELPIAAVARGAKLVEMHMMLAEEPSVLEHTVSLTQYGFRRMVESVRRTESMLS